jgi:hypothetical protein
VLCCHCLLRWLYAIDEADSNAASIKVRGVP